MKSCGGGCSCDQTTPPAAGTLPIMRSWMRAATRASLNSDALIARAEQDLQPHYALRKERLPSRLTSVIKPLSYDSETDEFMQSCSPDLCTSMAASLLRFFFSVTDTNAILRRGQMFVLSKKHMEELLLPALQAARRGAAGGGEEAAAAGAGGAAATEGARIRWMAAGGGLPAGASEKEKQLLASSSSSSSSSSASASAASPPSSASATPLRLLDVGAGDGNVTANLQHLFDSVTATEVSRHMCNRLRERGYSVHETAFLSPELFPEEACWDVVSIFNVLDRCDHPADLLRGAIRLLKPDTGRLLLAVVLPFSEFVEDGTIRRAVRGPLPMKGARCQDSVSLETSLSALVTRVLEPLGLQIERLARVPYLCRGDMKRSYYVLSDAIIVCKLGEELRPGKESRAELLRLGGPLRKQEQLPVLFPPVPGNLSASSGVVAGAGVGVGGAGGVGLASVQVGVEVVKESSVSSAGAAAAGAAGTGVWAGGRPASSLSGRIPVQPLSTDSTAAAAATMLDGGLSMTLSSLPASSLLDAASGSHSLLGKEVQEEDFFIQNGLLPQGAISSSGSRGNSSSSSGGKD